MRYKVGDKVVLRDDLTLSKETQYLKEEPNDVTGVTVSGYEIDGWHFEHDDIDHEKTVELHKQNTLNHYVDELERVVAAKNEIHQGNAVESKCTTSKFDRHKELTDYMHQTYIRKNKDYGDSFEQTHNKYGATAGLVRIADKFHRLENIILNDRETQVDDESVEDTLVDLANYALLLKMELEAAKRAGD